MPRSKAPETPCSVEGCDRLAKTKGLCQKHYMRQWLYGRTHTVRTGDKRSHPLYGLWWARKQAGVLAPEWLDLYRFAADVSPVPEGDFFLMRPRGDEPFGPSNFIWQQHLRRGPGESKKAWWARKWAARQLANPSMERGRSLRRRYGITPEQYDAMLTAQNGVCAICENAETAVEPKTGSLKRLAVDHHHGTGKVRGLLCWACNSALGKLDEDIDRLRAMIAYLEAHADDRPASL